MSIAFVFASAVSGMFGGREQRNARRFFGRDESFSGSSIKTMGAGSGGAATA
jgi:hypothetical protein